MLVVIYYIKMSNTRQPIRLSMLTPTTYLSEIGPRLTDALNRHCSTLRT